MVKIITLKLLIFFWIPALAQQQTTRLGSMEKLPSEFLLGKLMDAAPGEVSKLGDFSGKLLILDFWYTGCPACIADFPKLEKLQRQFGDRIQILLVNPLENEYQIKQRIYGKYNKSHGLHLLFEGNTLPILLASDTLKKLLPAKSFPSHAWIDGDGRVCLFGSSLNTHTKKINQFLRGEDISYIHTPFTGTAYDFKRPLLINALKGVVCGSALKPFDFDFVGAGVSREQIVDTITGTIRNTYINVDVIRLLNYTLEVRMRRSGWSEMVLHPFRNRYAWYLAYVSLEVEDSTRYSRLYADPKMLTDEHFSSAGFCYEAITPINMTDVERREWMYDDLKRYMGKIRNVGVKIEIRDVDCYEIRGEIPPGGNAQSSPEESLSSVISNSLGVLFNKNPKSIRYCVFLSRNIAKPIDFRLPAWDESSTLEDFRQALKKFDLKMDKTVRRLPVLVISENRK